MGASNRPFMGAIPYNDNDGSGVTFRVWAPFAKAIAAAGTFNEWSPVADPLFRETAPGYWSVDVPGAQVGHQYKFVISEQNNNALWRMDPYATSIVHDKDGNLNGLIASSDIDHDA